MNIPVVIGQVPFQKEAVDRLVKYCRDLDGTKVEVVPIDDSQFTPKYPVNEFACRQAHALRTVALAIGNRPFIWIESDSVPLRKGWKKSLSDEYQRCGKEFLLSIDEQPHDSIGGIGVYGPDTRWLIPEHFPLQGWDAWMMKHLSPLIARTPLIQHSYGIYDSDGKASPHRFPRDRKIIRKDAAIFHRDSYQDLIPQIRKGRPNRFLHSGDLGDVIASLPAVRAAGGGEYVFTYKPNGQRESMKGARYEAIRPLLEAQPYIASVHWEDEPTSITHDFTTFRKNRKCHSSLADNHAEHVGVEINLSPWLTVPNVEPNGRVVVARTLRYHNFDFPWMQLMDRHHKEAVFVGLPSEHSALNEVAKTQIPYRPTKNLLELAQLIAGAKLFIGNQSCPFWIAAGLGVPLIQESWEYDLNSFVPRDNARYTLTGPITRTLIYRLDNNITTT